MEVCSIIDERLYILNVQCSLYSDGKFSGGTTIFIMVYIEVVI